MTEGTIQSAIRYPSDLTDEGRLSNDYERKPTSSETQVYFASSRLLLQQIYNHQTPYKMAVR